MPVVFIRCMGDVSALRDTHLVFRGYQRRGRAEGRLDRSRRRAVRGPGIEEY